MDVSSPGAGGLLLLWGGAGSQGRASQSPSSFRATSQWSGTAELRSPLGWPSPGAKATSPPCEIDKWLWWFFFFPFPSWFLAESKMSLLFGFLLPLPHRLSLKVVFQISLTHVV